MSLEAKKTGQKRTILSPYDPLGYCPPNKRKQFAKRAKLAASGRNLSAIIELACLHCMNWQFKEVQECTDPNCPLWIRATRKKQKKVEEDSGPRE